jgi:hypothetical protein
MANVSCSIHLLLMFLALLFAITYILLDFGLVPCGSAMGYQLLEFMKAMNSALVYSPVPCREY